MEQMKSTPSNKIPRQEGGSTLGGLAKSRMAGLLLAAGILGTDCKQDYQITRNEIVVPQCDDGTDNDGDGWLDTLDVDCSDGYDMTEGNSFPVTECSDGMDNDGDGWTDDQDNSCYSCIEDTYGRLWPVYNQHLDSESAGRPDCGDQDTGMLDQETGL